MSRYLDDIPKAIEKQKGETPPNAFNDRDPRSVINLVPEYYRPRLKMIPKKYLDMDYKALIRLVKPDERLNSLRLRFWLEYDKCQADNLPEMDMTQVYGGVCTYDFFYNNIWSNSAALAFLLLMPMRYQAKLQEALDFSLIRMREMLEAELVDKDGQLNYKAGSLIVKIFHILDQRLHGAVVQKAEIKSLNVNVEASQADVSKVLKTRDVKQLEARLREIEAEEMRLGLAEVQEPELEIIEVKASK